ncbi:hypothetical protein M2275_008202 [Rhodococcus opacus]|nr:hypothetical protein [Rhodococcus opacus]
MQFAPSRIAYPERDDRCRTPPRPKILPSSAAPSRRNISMQILPSGRWTLRFRWKRARSADPDSDSVSSSADPNAARAGLRIPAARRCRRAGAWSPDVAPESAFPARRDSVQALLPSRLRRQPGPSAVGPRPVLPGTAPPSNGNNLELAATCSTTPAGEDTDRATAPVGRLTSAPSGANLTTERLNKVPGENDIKRAPSCTDRHNSRAPSRDERQYDMSPSTATPWRLHNRRDDIDASVRGAR